MTIGEMRQRMSAIEFTRWQAWLELKAEREKAAADKAKQQHKAPRRR